MLELTESTYAYEKGKPVFQQIGFRLQKGEVLAICGPNGGGKTTLIKTLTGILEIQRGKLIIEGEDYTGRRERSHYFGYVPQVESAAFSYSVFNMVLMGRARFGTLFSGPGDADRRVVTDTLAGLNLTPLGKRSFASLSGGEKQMVLIARALASEAPVLLFDEPTASLDMEKQERILRLIREFAREKQLTILFSTHDPNHVLFAADKVLFLTREHHGLFGPAHDVLTEETLSRIYGIEVKILSFTHQGRVFRTICPLFRV